VRWLDRLLSRSQSYTPSSIAELGEFAVDDRVELEGEVEGLQLLEDPLTGEAAVALAYRARTPTPAQRYFGLQSEEGTIEGQQGRDFLLRDRGGAALIVVEPGGDVGELHERLRESFGLNLEAEVDAVRPGDHIRVRGRIRELGEGGSPHRRSDWARVIVADELLPVG
jgi:hypothetical protein